MNNKAASGGDSLPVGSIIMWYGDSGAVPANWAVCDGTQDTPDLRDQFIVGAGREYSLSDTGGEATVELTEDQMPTHNHSNSTFQVLGTGAIVGQFPQVTGDADWNWSNLIIPGNEPITLSQLPNDGGGQAHENRPPYFALYFIMKIRD